MPPNEKTRLIPKISLNKHMPRIVSTPKALTKVKGLFTYGSARLREGLISAYVRSSDCCTAPCTTYKVFDRPCPAGGTVQHICKISSEARTTIHMDQQQQRRRRTTIIPQQALADVFLKTGTAILGLRHGLSTRSYAQSFRDNFKWGPGRAAYLYSLIERHPILPRGYGPKHLLWTLYFLVSYEKERRRCHYMKADRKTIRKFVWPTIIVISTLVPRFVSTIT